MPRIRAQDPHLRDGLRSADDVCQEVVRELHERSDGRLAQLLMADDVILNNFIADPRE
jgi:hypothetical protein